MCLTSVTEHHVFEVRGDVTRLSSLFLFIAEEYSVIHIECANLLLFPFHWLELVMWPHPTTGAAGNVVCVPRGREPVVANRYDLCLGLP